MTALAKYLSGDYIVANLDFQVLGSKDFEDEETFAKGYMLSYNFKQKKEVGVKEIHVGDRLLIEAVV